MVGSRRVSVEIGRQPIHNTACMDLGAFVNSAASQGIVFMNPSVFFPPGHEGSKSVSGVMVNTAVTHTAKIRDFGANKNYSTVRRGSITKMCRLYLKAGKWCYDAGNSSKTVQSRELHVE
jgi:hypothetical protein